MQMRIGQTGEVIEILCGEIGRTGASAPTEALQGVQWAGDRKGRPYGGLQEGAVRRADVGVRPYGTILALFT